MINVHAPFYKLKWAIFSLSAPDGLMYQPLIELGVMQDDVSFSDKLIMEIFGGISKLFRDGSLEDADTDNDMPVWLTYPDIIDYMTNIADGLRVMSPSAKYVKLKPIYVYSEKDQMIDILVEFIYLD